MLYKARLLSSPQRFKNYSMKAYSRPDTLDWMRNQFPKLGSLEVNTCTGLPLRRAGDVAQLDGCLTSMNKALGLIPSIV